MLKRISILLVTLVLILSLCPNAFAKNAQAHILDNALKDTKGWNTPQEETVYENNGITHKSADSTAKVFGYQNAKYLDGFVKFDTIMEFVDISNWQGFMIRAENTVNVPWKENKNYLIVITEKDIELQRFGFRHSYLAVKPTPFKSGERVSIEFGAFNIDEGVELVLRINGKTIFDVVDKDEAAIKTEGHFSIYNPNTISILPFTGDKYEKAPSCTLTSIKSSGLVGEKVEIDYTYSDFEDGTEGESEYAWYRTLVNIDHFGKLQAQPENYRENYMEKIEGATDRTYTITNEDIGFFLRCGIRTRSKETGLLGEEVLTDSVYVDTVNNILGNGIFFKTENQYALVNGENKKLDAISAVTPVILNNRMYVPLRFIAEALGYKVEWNQEIKQCTMTKDGKVLTVSLSDDVIMSYDRILLPIERNYDLFGIKSSYEPLYDLGMMNDVCAGLNPLDYKVILRDINEAIENK